VRKDLPANLRQAIQESLATMKARAPEAFAQGGQFFAGFVRADDARYQIIRELNEAAKALRAKR
jgi:ABC-type phosphate/phosphonate transport system substrate-binding protein